MERRVRDVGVGLLLALVAAAVYWRCARDFDAGRPDFYLLADAFLHGRAWLDRALGPWDVVVDGARIYVPFAPFPAIALMPLVAALGVARAAALGHVVDAGLAAFAVFLVWVLAGRIGVRRLGDRFWLALLFGFSTQIWWVATRGGVWHTGQLLAADLTLLALVEAWGRRRPLLLGLLAGAAFLTRAPLALAIPFFAWAIVQGGAASGSVDRLLRFDLWPWRKLVRYATGLLPAVGFFLVYNAVRFGSPLTSGYAEATLPDFLERQRALGLFSVAHLPMNLDYLLWHLPRPIAEFPFFRPDGLGLSILITSPGLLLAFRAPWGRARAVALGLTAFAVLVPSLLYYGGGWLQYGFRYALDTIPFVVALCAMAATRGRIGTGWRLAICFGVLVGAGGVWWAYHL